AWYYFFNEFKMTEFTREDFVSALQSYVLMSGEDISVALRSLNDDFACKYFCAVESLITGSFENTAEYVHKTNVYI
ncbi:MAG: DUF4007 family protein, partial [Clostridia bacterium]|nr:DUF4007 family protein [Clostridia bacterium]